MLNLLQSIDWEVFHFFNSIRHTALDEPVLILSGRYTWIPLYCVIMFILVRTCTWRQVLIYSAAVGIAIALTDQTCATLIRPLVERLRPSNPDNPMSHLVHTVNGYRGGSYGFPSCHAANSFALAVFITRLIPFKGFRVFMFAWAVLHSYSRIYLGVHYPGDLIVGALIGSFFGWACYCAARRLDSTSRPELTATIARRRITLPFGSGSSTAEGESAGLTLPVYHLMPEAFVATLIVIGLIAAF